MPLENFSYCLYLNFVFYQCHWHIFRKNDPHPKIAKLISYRNFWKISCDRHRSMSFDARLTCTHSQKVQKVSVTTRKINSASGKLEMKSCGKGKPSQKYVVNGSRIQISFRVVPFFGSIHLFYCVSFCEYFIYIQVI